MYVNLLLGVVALAVVWLFLKRLLVRDDALREAPAALLEKEVARRRAVEEERAGVFERSRAMGEKRMRLVVSALEEMRSAMPSLAGDTATATRKTLDWDDAGDSVLVTFRGGESGEAGQRLAVSWRIPDLDLRQGTRFDDDAPGVYILRRSGSGREETFPTLEACMREITSFIVDFMA